jgi:GT2 family glycosyltransferase
MVPATRTGDLSPDLDLRPVRKHPTVFCEDTLAYLRARPVMAFGEPGSTDPGEPRVSVIVVTHDNVLFLRLCLESILLAHVAARYELVVVDNCSSDNTAVYLADLQQRNHQVRSVRAESNLGFAAGVNLGAAHARGDVLVFVNDDVLVADGWIDRLGRQLPSASVGMVGPVTVSSTRDDRSTGSYRTLGEYLEAANSRSAELAGTEVPFLAMYCVALRRETYELIGPLDEGFGLGLFEDDDYCHRLLMAGFGLWCEESVLVHHFGEASLGKLKASGAYSDLFERNRKRFEEKWRLDWSPPVAPERPGYRDYTHRLRSALSTSIPDGSTVLVVSRGDNQLLDIPGVTALHFPQSPDGGYAGHYPEDGVQAEEALRTSRALGAEYLALPCDSTWWLSFYPELDRYLGESARLVLDEDDLVKVFSLNEGLA